MNTVNWNELLDRIAKIKSLSDRAGTQAEAEAAAAAMSRLLLRYNITAAQVDSHIERTAIPFETQEFEMENAAAWRQSLLHVLATNHLCRALGNRVCGYNDGGRWGCRQSNRVTIYGAPHNIVIIKDLYLWLTLEIDRLAERACADTDRCRSNPKAWRNAFRHGAARGLNHKLISERNALKSESTAAEWALVPVMEREVEDYMRQQIGNAKIKSRRSTFSSDGYDSGFRAGQDLNTNRRLGSDATRAIA